MFSIIGLKCDVAFPIEGFVLDVTKSFSVNDVTFELHNLEEFLDSNRHLERHNIKDIRILGVVRAAYGKDTHEIKSSAYQRVDRAVNILQFLVTRSLRTVEEVYFIKPLDDEGPVKRDNNNRFIALGQVEKSVSLDGLFPGPRFDAQNYVEEKLKPFGAIRPDRKETLEKALSYYRVAVCADNPYQAIESFFGAIQALVREEKKITDVTSKIMEDHIKPIIVNGIRGMTEGDFEDNFTCFWRKYRSKGTHGKYHVNDYSRMRSASIAKEEVTRWTWAIINDYIEKSIIR
jgi:hypothetical protein